MDKIKPISPQSSTPSSPASINNQVATPESESPPPLIARSLINKFEQLISNKNNSTRPKLVRVQSEALSFLPRTTPASSPSFQRTSSPAQSSESSKFFSRDKVETQQSVDVPEKPENIPAKPRALPRSPPLSNRPQRQNTVPVFFDNSHESQSNVSPSPLTKMGKRMENQQNEQKSPLMIETIETHLVSTDDKSSSNGLPILSKAADTENPTTVSQKIDSSGNVDFQTPKSTSVGLPQAISLDKWDARVLVSKLYELPQINDDKQNKMEEEFSLCGYLDKLPDQKKMSTILKTWKRKYFKLEKGILKSYDDQSSKEIRDTYTLAGGLVEDLGSLTISVDDKRGRYFTLRCADEATHAKWLTALQSQAAQEQETSFVKLVATSPPSAKKLVIMDIGSCSIRAGILCETAKLPEVFIPHVVLVEKGSHCVRGIGIEAYAPELRENCEIYKPLKHDSTWEKHAFDHGIVTAVMKNVFKLLQLNPTEYGVLLSIPSNSSDDVRIRLADVLLNDLNCTGVAMCGQSLVAFHAFCSSSGVLVNLGARTEIFPVTEGMVQTAGISRQIYGGERILAEFTDRITPSEGYQKEWKRPLEEVLLRYLMIQCCLVAPNKRLVNHFEQTSAKSVSLSSFQLPDGFPESIHVEHGNVSSSEGIFRPRAVYGIDTQSLAKQVNSAIQACPVDFRRTLYRSIYLSGGISLLQGIKERLQQEITALLPPQVSANIAVQVHAAPYREHAAFCGAWLMASTKGVLESALVTYQQWNEKSSSGHQTANMKRQLIARWPK